MHGPSVRKEEGDDQVGARNFRVWVMKAQFMPGARLAGSTLPVLLWGTHRLQTSSSRSANADLCFLGRAHGHRTSSTSEIPSRSAQGGRPSLCTIRFLFSADGFREEPGMNASENLDSYLSLFQHSCTSHRHHTTFIAVTIVITISITVMVLETLLLLELPRKDASTPESQAKWDRKARRSKGRIRNPAV